jgi:PAS domain S-box-containing protein
MTVGFMLQHRKPEGGTRDSMLLHVRPTWLFSAAFVVLLLAFNAVVFSVNINNLLDEQQLVTRDQDVLVALDRLSTTVAEAEARQWGYLLTHQDYYLSRYNTARSQIEPALQQLSVLTASDPAQQRRLPLLTKLVTLKLEEFQIAMNLQRTKGWAAAQAFVATDRAHRTLDQVHALLVAMQQTETTALSHRTASAKTATETVRLTLLIASLSDMALLGGLVLLLARNVTRAQQTAAERGILLAKEQEARFTGERAQQHAEQERARLARVLATLPVGVLIADGQGELVAVNQTSRGMFGSEVQEGVKLEQVRQHVVLQPDGTPYPPREWSVERSLQDGEEICDDAQIVLHDSGRQLPVLVSSAPLRDASGALAGVVATFQDITALKELDRQKEAFLSSVSHDLRNPLTSILAMAQVLQRQIARGDEPGQPRLAEGLSVIEQAAQDMADQIRELLDTSRLQMGRPLDLDLAPTDLVAMAEEVVHTYRASSLRHTVQLVSTEAPLECICDRLRMRRVLANLVLNSIKYSPQGGRVEIALARCDLDSAPAAEITVHDTGIGIPAADLPRIFDRFYRASNVGDIPGTGIGMTGVRQIVEEHCGSVDVMSSEGAGTTVTLRIPLAGPVPW